jgi:DNA mismatch repair ATPase MutS
MYENKDFMVEGDLPKNSDTLMSDLELKVLLDAMSEEDEFLYDVSKKALLCSLKLVKEVSYRQEILKDCIKNPDVVEEIYALTIKSLAKKQERWLGVFGRYPGSLLSSSVSLLDMHFELFEELRKIADTKKENFRSEGFKRFFEMVQKELDDEYISLVKEHLRELKFKKGVLLSARLGVANEGMDYTLRRDRFATKSWIGKILTPKSKEYSFSLHPRDDAGAKVLRNLRDEGLHDIANSLSLCATHVDNFFISLRVELAFYLGCMNLQKRLQRLGTYITFPDIFPQKDMVFSVKELCDISLALIKNKKVTGNEIEADKKELFFITGANQGGKSTFLRSVGQAQLMLQCGMFVPALSFKANICSGVFTHFKKEEDRDMKSGKFDEELARMNGIVESIKPHALILFNESFASTNEIEGSLIASQIIEALVEKNIKVFFVTHMYELAENFYKKEMKNTLFLRANRDKDGGRDFKITKAPPLQTSFAKDIYEDIFKN